MVNYNYNYIIVIVIDINLQKPFVIVIVIDLLVNYTIWHSYKRYKLQFIHVHL